MSDAAQIHDYEKFFWRILAGLCGFVAVMSVFWVLSLAAIPGLEILYPGQGVADLMAGFMGLYCSKKYADRWIEKASMVLAEANAPEKRALEDQDELDAATPSAAHSCRRPPRL